MNLTINAQTAADVIRAREALFGSGLDAKRSTSWETFGYPDTVPFEKLLQAYRRMGPAKAAVSVVLARCWRDRPCIKQEGPEGAAESEVETPWDISVERLLKPHWRKIRAWDERNLVGHYSGLILRVADGNNPREPLEQASRLVDLVPVWEDQLRVTAWNSDSTSEDYGNPAMWQYRARAVSNRARVNIGAPDQWMDVHPSRVIIWAGGGVSPQYDDGVPMLEAGYNSLVNLEKITGGSGESFLKNSARNVVVNFSPDADLSGAVRRGADGDSEPVGVKQALNDGIRRLNNNADAAIVTQGATVDTLRADNIDPSPAWGISASEFAASVSLPMTVIFGQQTGRLASDEDQKQVNALCEERRDNEITPQVEELIRRLQACGLIEPAEFEVEWEDLDAPTESDKLDRALKLVQIAKDGVQAGMPGVIEAAEVREAADLPPIDPAANQMTTEGDGEEDA